jgi:hypothetical protein
MTQNISSIGRSRLSAALLLVLSVVATGCSASSPELPVVSGRRVQNATVVAHGSVPFQLSAYEFVFTDLPGDRGHARRAALLVDFLGGQGHVRGFTEWGSSGKELKTYVTGGWARQKQVDGELVTVFELVLDSLEVRGARHVATGRAHAAPLALRVVVHEGSGEVTLTARH